MCQGVVFPACVSSMVKWRFFVGLLLFLVALADDQYDIIIEIEDVKQIAEEKRINVTIPSTPQPSDSFDIDKLIEDDQVRVFGILGLYNKGKTWFINRLFGTKFGSGTSHTTRGLSMKYFPQKQGWNSQWLVLDSAGTQSPVGFQNMSSNFTLKDRMDAELERTARKIMTERYIFDVVCYTSDVITFLVNDLTWIEQREIFALQHNFQIRRDQQVVKGTHDVMKSRPVIVVHNYKSTTDVAEAKLLFRQQVIQKHDGQQQEEAGVKGNFTYNLVRKNIFHYGLLWEEKDPPGYFGQKSEAQKINDVSIASLRNDLELSKVRTTHDFTFSRTFARTLAGSLEKLVSVEVDEDEFEDIDRAPTFGLTYERATNQFIVTNNLTLKLGMKGDFNEFNQVEVTESNSHFSISEITAYDMTPAYGNYELMRVAQVELPGVKRNDLRFFRRDSGWFVNVRRRPHPNFQKGNTPAGRAVIPLRFGDLEEKGKKWNFVHDANASLTCLTNIEANKRFYCTPVRFKDGILYVTAKVQKPFDATQRRRRQLMWF